MIGNAWDPVAAAVLAAIEPGRRAWPDGVDSVALLTFVGLAFGLPALGYWLMIIDIRRYLRSLRRALVVISQLGSPGRPRWAAADRPPCLDALGLTLPCSEEQVLAAYRKRIKPLHPDHGGDLRHFLRLQQHFEQALHLVRQRNQSEKGARNPPSTGAPSK